MSIARETRATNPSLSRREVCQDMPNYREKNLKLKASGAAHRITPEEIEREQDRLAQTIRPDSIARENKASNQPQKGGSLQDTSRDLIQVGQNYIRYVKLQVDSGNLGAVIINAIFIFLLCFGLTRGIYEITVVMTGKPSTRLELESQEHPLPQAEPSPSPELDPIVIPSQPRSPIPVVDQCPQATWADGHNIGELISLHPSQYKSAAISQDSVEVYDGPDFNSDILLTIYPRSQVTITGEAWDMDCNQWIQASVDEGSYWVHSSDLQLSIP